MQLLADLIRALLYKVPSKVFVAFSCLDRKLLQVCQSEPFAIWMRRKYRYRCRLMTWGSWQEIHSYTPDDIADGPHYYFNPDRILVRIVNRRDYKQHGETVDYNEKGILVSRTSYVNGKREGMCTTYYLNGQVCLEEQYRNDILDGLCRKYFPNGRLSKECFYSKGLKHGIEREWNRNESLCAMMGWINDKQDGVEEQYNGDGSLYTRVIWSHGVVLNDIFDTD